MNVGINVITIQTYGKTQHFSAQVIFCQRCTEYTIPLC